MNENARESKQFQISLEEAIELGAQDGLFFSQFFLPSSFPLEPATIHYDIWDVLDNKENEQTCLEVFRDGAKTTILRSHGLRRLAYGWTSYTLFISESESHSVNSVDWVRRRIEENVLLREVFQLEIGSVNNETELEIINRRYGTRTRIEAKGITGQLRGFNKNDARPDLIICDDIQTIENASTPEALDKLNKKFFGSVVPARAARSVHPFSSVVLLGTRVSAEDAIGLCELDPQWVCRRFSVFDERGQSVWPAKWTTEQLKKDKDSAIKRRQLSVWMREKECQLIRAEETAFNPAWAQSFIATPPNRLYFISCDPTPPPSEKQILEGFSKKDSEVWTVLAVSGKAVYIEEQRSSIGHEPDWSINTFFELVSRYRPRACGIETIAYQRTLASLITSEMRKRRQYTQIVPIEDKRKKFYRINQELGVLGSNGLLFVADKCHEFLSQFVAYPGVEHDDYLDSAAIGIMTIKKVLNALFETGDGKTPMEENDPYADEWDRELKSAIRHGTLSRAP